MKPHLPTRLSAVRFVVLLAAVLAWARSGVLAQGLTDPKTYLREKTPGDAVWSPDGQYLAYTAAGLTGADLYLYAVGDQHTTTLFSSAREDTEINTTTSTGRYYPGAKGLRWSGDAKRLFLTEGKNIVAVSPRDGERELLLSAELLGDLVELSPDHRLISFIRDGDIWVQAVEGGSPRRVTHGQGFLSGSTGGRFGRLLQWPPWSPDSKKIAFLSPIQNGWQVGVASVDSGGTSWIIPEDDWVGLLSLDWSPDAQYLAISNLGHGYRRKELMVASASGEWVRSIWVDTDEKWVDHNINPSFKVSWSPDGRQITFISNRTGWRHIYISDIDGREVKQITDGEYEVYTQQWLPNGNDLLAITSRGHLQQRMPWIIPARGRPAVRLADKPGVYAVEAVSPDGERIAFEFTGPGQLSSLVLVDVAGGEPTELYNSRPDGLVDEDVPHVEAVTFPSDDGVMVPAVLVTRKDLDRSRRHPAIVNMYGGWGQRALLARPSSYFNFMVNNGYVVLVVDPRGSDGYGDAYAKGLHHDAGGQQSDDLEAAAEYLASLPFVDPRGIGIQGHSYSGYLAVQTLVHNPDAFAAGIAGAPFGWDPDMARFDPYFSIRFGNPREAEDLQRERNPITNIGDLRAPLLILMGTEDINVAPVEVERLVKGLITAGKDFDYMVYPGEPHSWRRFDTNVDYYKRCLRFFDRHLRNRSLDVS